MEGIQDGIASDDCFLCGLLHPDRYSDDCPRCRKRMRYHPAIHIEMPALTSAVISTARRYQQEAPDKKLSCLVELMSLLHRFRPESLEALRNTELSLPQLRKLWRELNG